MSDAFDDVFLGMQQGLGWAAIAERDGPKELMWSVYDERCNSAPHHRRTYQTRANFKSGSATFAGWITEPNPSTGPYQGTSLVWFPSEVGSVLGLVIGTDGFGADTHILGRPGHRRRLRALSRLHAGKLWVKPDLLDIDSGIPAAVSETWPKIDAALKQYQQFIYAAVPVRDPTDRELVEDLFDLFFDEHQTPLTGKAKKRWQAKKTQLAGALFPPVTPERIEALLRTRRFVLLEGPPGTGKTHLALSALAASFPSRTVVQFHPARTYEDFVVGLHPRPTSEGLSFEVRPGDLLRANQAAQDGEHLLVIDEINRADLARVLGEAVILFEPTALDREVRLPHVPPGHPEGLRLSKNLRVLATRNTADRTIARMDVAIRRRFAFVSMWPQLDPVQEEGDETAIAIMEDILHTFAEHADDEALALVPGHAYLMDPAPEHDEEGRTGRILDRVELELLPLLNDYLAERLLGAASQPVAGLIDRIEARILAARAE